MNTEEKEVDEAGLWRRLMKHEMIGCVIRDNKTFYIWMSRSALYKGPHLRECHSHDRQHRVMHLIL